MPRKADQGLEGRIVEAAYQLWSRGGERALTMRKVAKAAKTTTPTLYERFKDKHDLLSFLRTRARERMFLAVQPARSATETCRLWLQFTLAHGNEYLLLTSNWGERRSRKEPMPSYEFLKAKLVKELGETSEGHAWLSLALVALVHGTAILLLGEGVQADIAKQFEKACLEACDGLIEHARREIGRPAKG
ncbi:MAG TPA: helix-turn-helix domain-containing protein [Candidatus Methylomirabilis sp.]|nr:helix-turn-helix domain-containing protein [Candidatus Methylomirabilis sp.]